MSFTTDLEDPTNDKDVIGLIEVQTEAPKKIVQHVSTPIYNRLNWIRGYESGENLYRVNCSFCHGNEGLGDGPAKEYIISENSYYSTNKVDGLPGSGSGTPYISPPQLLSLIHI